MEFKYRQAIVRGCKFGPLALVVNIVGTIVLIVPLFIILIWDAGKSASGVDALFVIVYLFAIVGIILLFLSLIGISIIAGIRSIKAALADIRDLGDAAIVSGISGVATGVSYTVTMYVMDIVLMAAVWGIIGYFLGSYGGGGSFLGLTSIMAVLQFGEVTFCSVVYIIILGSLCGVAAAIGGAVYSYGILKMQ